jgi:hypothetical protein
LLHLLLLLLLLLAPVGFRNGRAVVVLVGVGVKATRDLGLREHDLPPPLRPTLLALLVAARLHHHNEGAISS